MKNKSEFVLVLNPKFDVSAQEKYERLALRKNLSFSIKKCCF